MSKTESNLRDAIKGLFATMFKGVPIDIELDLGNDVPEAARVNGESRPLSMAATGVQIVQALHCMSDDSSRILRDDLYSSATITTELRDLDCGARIEFSVVVEERRKVKIRLFALASPERATMH